MKLCDKVIKEGITGSVVTFILVLGIIGFLEWRFQSYKKADKTEGFTSGALYPASMSKTLLAPPFGNRPMMPKGPCAPGLSNETYSTEWKLYPKTPMSSYAQVTNNKEYWRQPCNGTTLLPEMCGGLYTKIDIKKPRMSSAPPISPRQGERVNYYVSTAGRPPEQ